MVLWSIKGYHIFKIRPCSYLSLTVSPDENNPYDQYAMVVKMPLSVPEEDAKRGPQKVREITGKHVGRVPANLSKVFQLLLQKNFLASEIACFYGGRAGHTADVPHRC